MQTLTTRRRGTREIKMRFKTIQSRYTMKLNLMRKQFHTSYEKTLHLQQKKCAKTQNYL